LGYFIGFRKGEKVCLVSRKDELKYIKTAIGRGDERVILFRNNIGDEGELVEIIFNEK
jgi:hypothetical protein